ncbi:metabolite traffic protein EboE [Phycicoccus flavus]|uniref:metabolite traffic protein EboE n=1 Tax=Phycicoccus flavus TaxID=2502783 RepID=UPI000FEBFC09|nr:metabolite traffic protein EboE [Phycicoccus flavus]NHA67860.1 metabolite traffic protein EboE [Phycicoccus flavus]
MRLRHADGTVVHLAYCTNVHAGDDLEDVLNHLDRFCLPVRRHLGVDLLGVGLWLAAPAAAALAADPAATARLRTALEERGLETVTLNGFPYRGFQEPVVKHRVYHPDWADPARLRYTLDCAEALAGLLPDDAARGSVSTLPFAWRTPWEEESAQRAAANLARLGEGLADLEQRTGRTVRVGMEPEPGCVVETTSDAVRHLGDVDHERVGVTLDLCHLATGFEDPDAAVARVGDAGLSVVKAQVSAALQGADPSDPDTLTALADFDESRFLHQVRGREADGTVRSRDDLPDALRGDAPLPVRADGVPVPWRVHVHVPLGAELEAPLDSTLADTCASLEALVGGPSPRTDHLEVETYTWGVLPDHLRPSTDDELAARIAGELGWARDVLVDLGLKELP